MTSIVYNPLVSLVALLLCHGSNENKNKNIYIMQVITVAASCSFANPSRSCSTFTVVWILFRTVAWHHRGAQIFVVVVLFMCFGSMEKSRQWRAEFFIVYLWRGLVWRMMEVTLSVCVCVCSIVHLQVHRCTLFFVFFCCPPPPVHVGTIAHVLCVSACILYE